jgi:hypothetical protein
LEREGTKRQHLDHEDAKTALWITKTRRRQRLDHEDAKTAKNAKHEDREGARRGRVGVGGIPGADMSLAKCLALRRVSSRRQPRTVWAGFARFVSLRVFVIQTSS